MQHESSQIPDCASPIEVTLSTMSPIEGSQRIVPSAHVPRLLVSVRNVEEAAAAMRGGCEILDVKEPARGSLGMADADVLHQIAHVARRQQAPFALTAALGEVHEYPANRKLDLLPELNLVKLGCAGLGTVPDWRQNWANVRRTVSQTLSAKTGWVAVAYADWQLAEAPSPAEIIAEALLAGCRGVLFDTYSKSGRRLLDWISVDELQQIAAQVHSAGLFLALAGSLRTDDLPALRNIPADIIAIRGAACCGGQRTDAIQESAVRDFRAAVQQCWMAALATVGQGLPA